MNSFPPQYNAHIEKLWEATKHELPVELQSNHYRDHVFKIQRWLRDAMRHHGYNEEFIEGVQVGMADWLINLASLGDQASFTTMDYAKSFFRSLISDIEVPPFSATNQPSSDYAPNHEGSMDGSAEVLGTPFVLNNSMKSDSERLLVFTKNGEARWEENLVNGTFLGVGWLVGQASGQGLYWLDCGDTCFESEVMTVHVTSVPTALWDQFLDNAKRTTITEFRIGRT